MIRVFVQPPSLHTDRAATELMPGVQSHGKLPRLLCPAQGRGWLVRQAPHCALASHTAEPQLALRVFSNIRSPENQPCTFVKEERLDA